MADIINSPTLQAPAAPVKLKVAQLVFDNDGEIILVLPCSFGQARFQVNSTILSLASSVFRAMLGTNSSFKEGRDLAIHRASLVQMPPVEILLADDDPHVLAFILRILHLQYDYAPASAVTPERLYQIAVLCDKYDMRASLAFWLEKCMCTHFYGSELSADKWLFMSYVFLKGDEFKRLTREVILSTQMDNDGNLQTSSDLHELSSTITFSDYIPQPVLAEILAFRQQTFESIIDEAHCLVEAYTMDEIPKCPLGTKECDSIALGTLLHRFRHIGIYPETTSLMKNSVEDLKKLIDGLAYPSTVYLADSTVVESCCSTPQSCVCPNPLCAFCGSNLCRTCGKKRRAYSTTKAPNHASCGPIAKFQSEVTAIVAKVEGLNLTRFVKGHPGASMDLIPTDPWRCLEFK